MVSKKSNKKVVSKKSKKKKKIVFFVFLLFLIGKIRHGIGKKGGYFQLGMGPKFGRKGPDTIPNLNSLGSRTPDTKISLFRLPDNAPVICIHCSPTYGDGRG